MKLEGVRQQRLNKLADELSKAFDAENGKRSMRKQQPLTLRSLARITGLSASHVHNVFAAKVSPDYLTVELIAAVLGASFTVRTLPDKTAAALHSHNYD